MQHPMVGAALPPPEQLQVPLNNLRGTTYHRCHHPKSLGARKCPDNPRSKHDSTLDYRSLQRSEALADRDLEIDQRLKKMDQQIEAIHNLSSTPNGRASNEPSFNNKIMQAPLPRHFKILLLENYDRTTNLDDHLASFRITMLLHGSPILYQAYPSILKGAARYWYTILKLESVHSFEQLNRAFTDHFVNS